MFFSLGLNSLGAVLLVMVWRISWYACWHWEIFFVRSFSRGLSWCSFSWGLSGAWLFVHIMRSLYIKRSLTWQAWRKLLTSSAFWGSLLDSLDLFRVCRHAGPGENGTKLGHWGCSKCAVCWCNIFSVCFVFFWCTPPYQNVLVYTPLPKCSRGWRCIQVRQLWICRGIIL
jgi:hypothetical protein